MLRARTERVHSDIEGPRLESLLGIWLSGKLGCHVRDCVGFFLHAGSERAICKTRMQRVKRYPISWKSLVLALEALSHMQHGRWAFSNRKTC